VHFFIHKIAVWWISSASANKLDQPKIGKYEYHIHNTSHLSNSEKNYTNVFYMKAYVCNNNSIQLITSINWEEATYTRT